MKPVDRAVANGFGIPDLAGFGISVDFNTIAPVGKNTARGNDDPTECNPAFLC